MYLKKFLMTIAAALCMLPLSAINPQNSKMKELNEKTAGKMLYPERIIQFGEGNFLRAFVDWIIDRKSVV